MRTYVTTQIEEAAALDFNPTLIFGFYIYQQQARFASRCEMLMKTYPDADIVGCSTASVIGNTFPYVDIAGASEAIFIFTDMKKEAYSLNVFFDRSYESGAVSLDENSTYAAVLLSTHQNRLENDKVLGRIREKPGITDTSGALAANAKLKIAQDAVSLYCNGVFRDKGYILLLINEAMYQVQGRSLGSFEPIGFEMNITKARQNVIFEIDGKPALDAIEEVIGELSEYGIKHYSYPFFIWDGKNSCASESLPLRTLLDIDRREKHLQFFNDIETGYKIRPAIRINEEREREMLSRAHKKIEQEDLILLFVCVALRDFEEEMEHVYLMQLLNNTHVPVGGLHTFGEIGHAQAGACAILNNQTITYVSITEKGHEDND